MTTIPYFRSQAYNNAWCNHRLLEACGLLSAEELAAVRISFFPSIMLTLNHILTVDWLYMSALEGNGVPFRDEVPCPALADLAREQRAVDRRLIALCESARRWDLRKRRSGATCGDLNHCRFRYASFRSAIRTT
ncbi:MAG: DinB family protein [Woeseiaceae bacterium]